jgi:hypothetical protein
MAKTPEAAKIPEAPKAPEAPPPMPAAQARELLRDEVQRWQRLLDIATAAATYEDEAGDLERRLAVLREQRATAESEHTAAMEASDKRAQDGELDSAHRIEVATREARLAEDEATTAKAVLQAAIDAKQRELTQISNDLETEQAKFKKQIADLATERNTLMAELTRLKARFAA